MKFSALYLFATIAVMFVCLCDGANIRVKRSYDEVDLDLDSNGFCKTERTWSRDCNQCWCPEGGKPACTLIGCSIRIPDLVAQVVIKDDVEAIVPVRIETILDVKCVPGTTWTKDCNSCVCTDDGLPTCTKKGCVSLVEKEGS